MKTIWKFSLRHSRAGTVPMPEGAVIRHVGRQAGSTCIWAEVDTEAPCSLHTFQVFGTGEPLPETTAYLGTYVEGPSVWHLYETTP